MNSHLTTLITQLPSDQLITITGATVSPRNGDVHYPFRQDSDFLYLTGLSVPGLVLTIGKSLEQNPPSLHSSPLDRGAIEIILWREAITDLDRVWGSDKISDEEMVRISGIEDIRDRSDLEEYNTRHREERGDPENKKGIPYTDWIASYPKSTSNASQKGAARNDETGETDWKSIIHSLRLIKTPDEIEKIKKAISVSQEAFAHIESIMKP
jgi:Xaa-Pro aminopeptidase